MIDKNKGMLDGLYPQTLQAYQTADGYFGLPRDFQTIVLFYNKDMFDKAGVAYPTADWTWDDLRAAAKKLTLDTNGDGKTDQYGYSFDMWDMEPGWSEAVWSYGGDILNADHTKTLIGEPASREAWQFLHDMTFVDKSVPDANTADQFGGDTFAAGASAMTALGHWVVPGYADAGLKFDVAPMPKGPAGRFTSVNSAGFVIAKATKHPNEAFSFLKFVLSTAGQTRLAELGFACPVLKSIAESDTFLKQKITLDQQVFLDALQYAKIKPVFKGYDEWASAVGDGMAPVWSGEAELNKTLDEVVVAADEVLSKNK
jgi:multiple sugar transport system substrate-binding protein